uniref:Uncharacterized protein n=1 Tax=Tanacetum cinerariifolium TaxID=118510 RepID=A0A699K895_TANCI|nr:hypothetical protein [Tanacetum cinerariifolium]
MLEIVPEDDDDDVTIEETPLSSKSPTIVDYKIYKEGKKSYFKIIRADGNSQNYLTFGKMFKNFNIEDLEVLWSIVKERFKKTKPVDAMDNPLFQTLKTMFEHKGRIAEIDADEDLSLINKTTQDQGRMNKEYLFKVINLDGDEVIVGVTAGENVERDATVAKKEAKDKGKRIMVEPEKPLKKKDQISLDEKVARNLEAQMKAKIEKKERIEREKDEANIAVIEEWDDVQATINADKQLAEQLQAQKREQLSIKERSKLLAELIESRRKYFAAKRAKEIKNKPPTKAQQKSLTCTYMKNMEGYKQKNFKGKSFDAIKKMFDKVYKGVNTFVDMNTEIVEERLKKTQAEVTEGSSKRAGDKIE